jgi:hypothetical protein
MASEFKTSAISRQNRIAVRNSYRNPYYSRTIRSDEIQFYTWQMKDVQAHCNIIKNNLIRWVSENIDILDDTVAVIGHNQVIIKKDDMLAFFAEHYNPSTKNNSGYKYLTPRYGLVFKTAFLDKFKNQLTQYEVKINEERRQSKLKQLRAKIHAGS